MKANFYDVLGHVDVRSELNWGAHLILLQQRLPVHNQEPAASVRGEGAGFVPRQPVYRLERKRILLRTSTCLAERPGGATFSKLKFLSARHSARSIEPGPPSFYIDEATHRDDVTSWSVYGYKVILTSNGHS